MIEHQWKLDQLDANKQSSHPTGENHNPCTCVGCGSVIKTPWVPHCFLFTRKSKELHLEQCTLSLYKLVFNTTVYSYPPFFKDSVKKTWWLNYNNNIQHIQSIFAFIEKWKHKFTFDPWKCVFIWFCLYMYIGIYI